MTITLVDDVQPGQAIILVSAPEEMALDKIYQVDQELIILRSSPRSSRVSVGRGMFGSTRATHAAAATLTPVSLVAQPRLPVAPPVAPSVQRIGPFNLRFDTPGLVESNSIRLADLIADSALVDVWMEPTTPWTGPGMDVDDQVIIGLRGTGGTSDYQIRKKFLVNESASTVPGVAGASTSNVDNGILRLVTAGTLIASVNFSGTPNAGEANVYAIIAIPGS